MADAKTIGIIGFGSMGSIVAKCLHQINTRASGQKPYNLWALVKHEEQETKVKSFGFVPFLHDRNNNFKQEIDVCILAVRPEQICPLLKEWSPTITKRTKPLVVISLAAGVPLKNMEQLYPNDVASGKVQFARLMPNTLVIVGKGSLAFCKGTNFSDNNAKLVYELFQSLGNISEIEEDKMNIFTALAGCTPALHYHILESFIEAGVTMGLSREMSTQIAISLMQGCGQCAKELNMHPALLREASTAPASMTSEGLYLFDKSGIRGLIIEAVRATATRGKAMDCENAKDAK